MLVNIRYLFAYVKKEMGLKRRTLLAMAPLRRQIKQQIWNFEDLRLSETGVSKENQPEASPEVRLISHGTFVGATN